MIPALYARVSTGRQENEKTIESQLDEILTKSHEDNLEIRSDLRFVDNGWPGELLARPNLDRLRDAATRGEFHVLYLYDLGRLSRTFLDQLILLKEFQDLEIKIISLHDINAENDEQTFARNVMGLFHDYERKKIAERMRRGKLYKASNGILINGHSLYGYNYIRKNEVINDGIKQTQPARYEINKEQAKVVRMIFDWVGNERISLNEVIRRLYDMGIPPRKGKSEFWTKGPIVRMLQCKSYIDGVIYYNKSESCVAKNPIKNVKYKKIKKSSRKPRPESDWKPFNVPAILDDRLLFDRVQEILKINQRYAPKNRKHNYLLSSQVFCGCGNRRAGDGQNKYGHFYYRCTERIYNFPSLERKCKLPGVNAVILDGMVWNELMKFVKDPETLRKKVEEVLKERKEKTANKQEYDRLTGLITKIEEEEQRYAKAYGAGTLEFEQFKDLMRETKKKKLSFQDQLETIKADSNEVGLDKIQVDDICYEAKKVLDEIDYTDQEKSFKMLLDKVTIKEGGWVNVCGHIPLFAQKLGYEPTSRNSRFTQRWEKYFV